ncbi:MAG: hypothetical protein Q7T15_10905 [Microcella sp.]|uniref:hypothetical protein n=1 Tax=Microcella sp. TaxID=1913979 RepID=UPI0027163033|nr:hypothetical protein [Microcella sp.]MDO8338747.1 hypothetical protein [Microcella sp.]
MTVLGALSRLVPDRVIAGLLPRERSFDPSAPPSVPEFPPSSRARVLVAPVNAAGQGEAWARSIERELDGVAALSLQVGRPGGFAHDVGILVPPPVFTWSRDWQSALRVAMAESVTHVLLESGRPILAGGVRGDVERDLRWLAGTGITTALLWHGSDIRDGRRHASEHAHSPYADASWPHRELDAIATRNRRLAARSGVPSLVSTPDLLDDVPGATWLPVVVDPALWAMEPPPPQRGGLLRVVHAPSSGPIKGSELVEPIVRTLAAEGVIEYRRIEGVPHAEMPAVVRGADVVLEQFRLGSYGVAAVEAMAAGRIVIGSVDERVADRVDAASGLRPPILSSSPDGLYRLLRELAADPSAALASAARGPEFVRRVHDGSLSASVIGRVLALGSEPRSQA